MTQKKIITYISVMLPSEIWNTIHVHVHLELFYFSYLPHTHKKIQKYNHPCKKEKLIQSIEKMKFSQCWYTFFYVLEIKNSIYFLTENL